MKGGLKSNLSHEGRQFNNWITSMFKWVFINEKSLFFKEENEQMFKEYMFVT